MNFIHKTQEVRRIMKTEHYTFLNIVLKENERLEKRVKGFGKVRDKSVNQFRITHLIMHIIIGIVSTYFQSFKNVERIL